MRRYLWIVSVMVIGVAVWLLLSQGDEPTPPRIDTPAATTVSPQQPTATPIQKPAPQKPYITTLQLSLPVTETNKETTITPTLTATYSNQTTKDLTEDIRWIITPDDALQVQGMALQTIKDTNTTIQAQITNFLGETIISNEANLSIYWEVNGHRVPPMPDKALNDSTLLGIDSNDNGVRDDVERWIYEEYKDKHPVYAALAMEGAKAFQEALKGSEHYEKAHKMSSDAIDCEGYYKYYAEMNGEKLLVDEDDRVAGREVLSKVLSTQERVDAYIAYDNSLSGGVYDSPNTIPGKKATCSKAVLEVVK